MAANNKIEELHQQMISKVWQEGEKAFYVDSESSNHYREATVLSDCGNEVELEYKDDVGDNVKKKISKTGIYPSLHELAEFEERFWKAVLESQRTSKTIGECF